MTLLFIYEWFDSTLAKAIGWTLIHSLWQGFLLAIAAGLIILFTKKAKPDWRYSLLTALFFIFILLTSSTFIYEIKSAAVVTTEISPTAYSTEIFYNPSVTDVKIPDSSFSSRFTGYFNTYGYLIIAVWFIIFMLKFIKLAINFGHIQRIRKTNRSFSVPSWEKRADELAALLNITRSVSLRESIAVKVPVAIGYLKPLILLPIGMVNNLPADQVEAIILHELAHIRRKDYIVNLLQCIAETIFFFNPAVLWLSSLLREERENCCDDIAISILKKKSTFIKALMAFQEYSAGSRVLTPAFSTEKYPLLKRIQRIAYNNNKNLNNMEKIFLGAGLVVTGLLAFAFSSKTANQYKKPDSVVVSTEVVNNIPVTNLYSQQGIRDTVPFDINNKRTLNGTIISTIDEKNYKILVKDGNIIELYVDDKLVPGEKIGDYKTVTDKMIRDAKEHNFKLKLQAEEYQKQSELMKEQARISQKRNDEMTMLDKQMAERQSGILKEQMLLREKQADFMNERFKKLQDELVKEQQKGAAGDLKRQREITEQQSLLEKMVKERGEDAQRLQSQLQLQQKQLLQKQTEFSKEQEKLMNEYRKKSEELNVELKKSMEELYQKRQDSTNSKTYLYNKLLYDAKGSYDPLEKMVYESNHLGEYKAFDRFNYNTPSKEAFKLNDQITYNKEEYLFNQFNYFPLNQKGWTDDEYKRSGKIVQTNIINDLKKEKGINNDHGLSVKLTQDELIVNGVKQPANLHKKLKDKYLKDSDKPTVLQFNTQSREVQ